MIVILGKDILPSTSATISTVLRIRKNVLLTLALLRQLITMPPIIHTRNKRNIIYISEAANADTSVVAVSYPVSSAKNPNIERPPIIHAATTNNNSKKFLLFSFLLSIIPPFALLSQLWRKISSNLYKLTAPLNCLIPIRNCRLHKFIILCLYTFYCCLKLAYCLYCLSVFLHICIKLVFVL